MSDAVLWWDAYDCNAASTSVPNSGTGGSTALAGQYGSAAGADTNDPKWLPSGNNAPYVYFPGVGANYLSLPNLAEFDITGDISIVADFAMVDWTPGATMRFGGNEGAYAFGLNTSGGLQFIFIDATSTFRSTNSSVAVGIADGTRYQVAVTKLGGTGTNDVRFWKRPANANTWQQVGTTQSSSGTSIIGTATGVTTIGSDTTGAVTVDGFCYEMLIYNTVVAGGTPPQTPTGAVLDVNIRDDVISEQATSFTCTTGQTVTVVRAASGRKTVVVDRGGRARWLFGTDDYIISSDNSLIDFGASQSFSMVAVRRRWGTAATANQSLGFKIATGSAGPWYGIYVDAATQKLGGQIFDGAINSAVLSAVAPTEGTMLAQALVRDVGADLLRLYEASTQVGSATDTTTASLANSGGLNLGFNGSNSWWDGEVVMVAIFSRVLTGTEVGQIQDFYAGGPVPVFVGGGELGCGLIGCYLVRRSTPTTVVRDLTPDLVPGSRCSRVLNDVSDATITLKDCYDGEPIYPWYHSLLFTWDGQFIWHGPVTKVSEDASGQGHIDAQDIMAWMRKRLLMDEFDSTGFPVDASAAFVSIVANGFDQDVSVPYVIIGNPTGITVERAFLEADCIYVADAIDELVTTGSDYTVFLNQIFCGDVEGSIIAQFSLNPAHMKEKPTVTYAGDDQATRVTICIDKEAAGVDKVVEQSPMMEAQYGLLDLVERENDIKDAASATDRAKGVLDFRRVHPVLIEGILLESTAPMQVNDLIPGIEFEVFIPGAVAPYFGKARLQSVEITENDNDGRWAVQIHCNTLPEYPPE